MHFVRLATTLLKDEESARNNHVLRRLCLTDCGKHDGVHKTESMPIQQHRIDCSQKRTKPRHINMCIHEVTVT